MIDPKPQYAERLKMFLESYSESPSIPDWIEQRYNEAYLTLRANNHAIEIKKE